MSLESCRDLIVFRDEISQTITFCSLQFQNMNINSSHLSYIFIHNNFLGVLYHFMSKISWSVRMHLVMLTRINPDPPPPPQKSCQPLAMFFRGGGGSQPSPQGLIFRTKFRKTDFKICHKIIYKSVLRFHLWQS